MSNLQNQINTAIITLENFVETGDEMREEAELTGLSYEEFLEMSYENMQSLALRHLSMIKEAAEKVVSDGR